MLRSLDTFESILRDKRAIKVLTFLLKRLGKDVNVIREKENAERQEENAEPVSTLTDAAIAVYGEYSGISPAKSHPEDTDPDPVNVIFPARILFSTVLANAYDAAASGDFEEQTIFTFDDVTTNDRIELTSTDGSKKYYLIMEPAVAGKTTDIYKLFKIINVGE